MCAQRIDHVAQTGPRIGIGTKFLDCGAMSIRAVEINSSAWRALWLAGFALLLAGLLGMHGLDNHGSSIVGSGDDMQMLTASAPSPSPVAAPGRAVTSGAVEAATMGAVDQPTWAPQKPTGPGMGTAGMCLAFLILTMVAGRVALRRCPSSFGGTVDGSVPPPTAQSRAPDPPSLTRLSIRRC